MPHRSSFLASKCKYAIRVKLCRTRIQGKDRPPGLYLFACTMGELGGEAVEVNNYTCADCTLKPNMETILMKCPVCGKRSDNPDDFEHVWKADNTNSKTGQPKALNGGKQIHVCTGCKSELGFDTIKVEQNDSFLGRSLRRINKKRAKQEQRAAKRDA
jgi:hypothetical protein